MATSQLQKRILVHLRSSSNAKTSKADFTQSIVDSFSASGDVVNVYAEMVEDKCLISKHLPGDSTAPIKLKRPSFCPIHCMLGEQKSQLPAEIASRGVDVGAVAVVESCDGKILLTRRAKHLRTYPNIWVPPGGHVEKGETLQMAALRELYEETGLKITEDNCTGKTVPILALWESTFPPRLSLGPPRRHHIVAYIHVRLEAPMTSSYLGQRLQLDASEVSAATWLGQKEVYAIVAVSEETREEQSDNASLPDFFSGHVLDESGELVMKRLPMINLLRRAEETEDGEPLERVSTGSKFALEEWLKLATTTNRV